MPRIAAIAIGLLVASCGGDDATVAPGSENVEISHVHGLGVNPADDALLIATHHGLFRAAPDEDEARLVGDLQQDTMGFAIAGPDHFLASGHPDVRADARPLLGLIQSRDAGTTWDPVILEGEADFHAIEVVGDHFYAHDAHTNRLFEGRTGGRGLSLLKTPPGALIDLAADPGAPEDVFAATDRGLFSSRDGARSWKRVKNAPLGLLAHNREQLVVVTGQGDVHAADPQARAWERVGSIKGAPVALVATGGILFAAVQDGAILRSTDGGRTWSVRVRS